MTNPTHQANDSPGDDERFAKELERLDQSLSSVGDGSQPGSTSPEELVDPGDTDVDGEEIDAEEIDDALNQAADVLQLMRRVRRFEEQSSSSIGSPLARETQTADDSVTPRDVHATKLPDGDVAPKMIGRFRILRLLGSGGFGLVYLAVDSKLDRQVAIKVPRPEVLATSSSADRFLREGKAAAALNHPNIVPVFEVGEIGNVAYIASAFCPGLNLAEWLHRHGKLKSQRAAAAIVARLADAAEHAHRRGILHRDLKPANVLLELPAQEQPHSTTEPKGDDVSGNHSDVERGEEVWSAVSEFDLAARVRINDFGLARLDDTTAITQTTSTLGTPSYMPPEQADPEFDSVGPASDVYSLGAILYQLLTGQPPFQEATILSTLDAVRHRAPTPPRKLVDGLSADLEAITLKCLEKRREHRYQSAAALADDLERFLDRSPVRARRIRSDERFARWCRNNPLVASLAGAVLLLAIGSTVASVLLARSRSETRDALEAAVRSNRQSLQNEYRAQVALADSVQKSSAPGQRVESLTALRRAALLGQELNIGTDSVRQLRNSVISALSKTDLTIERRWPVQVVGESFLATTPDCQQYLHVGARRQNLICREISDNSVHSRYEFERPADRVIGMRFSADGSRLGARYAVGGRERLQLWNTSDGSRIKDLQIAGFGHTADFSVDGDQLAMVAADRKSIELYRLPECVISKTIRINTPIQTLALSPDEKSVALHHSGGIDVIDVNSDRVRQRLECPSFSYSLNFSPDGHWLAATCRDGRTRLFKMDADTTDRRAPNLILDGHAAMVVTASWHPTEPLLVTCSMDGKSILWDLRTGRSLLKLDFKCTNFSRDGNWLGIEGGRMAVDLSRSRRTLPQSDSKVITPIDLGFYPRGDVTSEIDYWVSRPQGRLVIGQNYFRAVFRDVSGEEALADVEVPGCWFRFGPQGKWLYASSQLIGFCRLPVQERETESTIEMKIGPPQPLHPARGGAFAIASDRFVVTPFFSTGHVLTHENGRFANLSRLNVHPYTCWCDLSPDGRLVATGAMKASDVRIFDAATGKQVKTLPSDSAAPWFSPDGHLLVVAENARYTVYETDNWTAIRQMDSVAGGIWPGSLAFSNDGKVLALEFGSQIRLIRTDDYSPIARFRVSSDELIESIRFSGDGRFLISGGGDQDHTHVWDLNRIRSELRTFGLDWDENESLPESASDKPIHLQLELGEIANTTKSPFFPGLFLRAENRL